LLTKCAKQKNQCFANAKSFVYWLETRNGKGFERSCAEMQYWQGFQQNEGCERRGFSPYANPLKPLQGADLRQKRCKNKFSKKSACN
jgi:hypothetical protein